MFFLKEVILSTSSSPSTIPSASLPLVPIPVPPPPCAPVVVAIVIEAVVKVPVPHHPTALQVAVPRPPSAEGPELAHVAVDARLLALVRRARGQAPAVADVVAVKVRVDVGALGQQAVGAAGRPDWDEAGAGNGPGKAHLGREPRLDWNYRKIGERDCLARKSIRSM